MTLRRITSLTALLSFAALVFTAVLIYLAPRGPGSSQWETLGLGKHEWFALHTNLGILFLVSGIVHTILNIKPIISYLRNKEKQLRVFTLPFNLALLLTAWVIAGSILDWVPFSSIRSYKENLGSRGRHHPEAVEPAGERMPDKPPFLYGSRSLEKLCEKYALETAFIIRELEKLGIQARADWSVNRIAEANSMKPASVYDAVRQVQDSGK